MDVIKNSLTLKDPQSDAEVEYMARLSIII